MCDDDQIPVGNECFKKLLDAGKDMVSGLVRLRTKRENLNVLYSTPYQEDDKL